MLGQNAVAKQVAHDGTTLSVHEIFYTVQGEGPSAGVPAVFVRLAGCNLRCWYCDTEFERYTDMDATEVEERVLRTASEETAMVVLTGGEPMRQNLLPLIRVLLMDGYDVEVETAGTLWFQDWHGWLSDALEECRLRIVCSPKTPKVHRMIEHWAFAYKYIITDVVSAIDGLPVENTQRRSEVRRRSNTEPLVGTLARPPSRLGARDVYVQPCDYMNDEKNLASMQRAAEVSMKFGYRLSIQTHKIVGLP